MNTTGVDAVASYVTCCKALNRCASMLCCKEGNPQALEEPKCGRNASGYQRRNAISGERQKVGGRAA